MEKIDTEQINLPIISVIINTHNRTNVLLYVLKQLFLNLKYPNLQYIIADDRSQQNHIDIIDSFLKSSNKIYKIIRSTEKRYGLGGVLNMALEYSFQYSPIVLTMEDDWVLEKQLDLTLYVQPLLNEQYAAIRLATQEKRTDTATKYFNLKTTECRSSTESKYVFNLQCALRHKRIYDKIGYYRENVDPPIVEKNMRDKYNNFTNFGRNKDFKVCVLADIKINTLDDPSLYFIHVGKSTIKNHKYTIPVRYQFLYKN